MAKRLFAIVLVAVCLIIAPRVSAERDYHFPRLIIEAAVWEDGTLEVVEVRTAKFTGTYTGMYQWIDLSGGIEITDVQVGEPDAAYEYNPAHDIGPPGTYFAEGRGSEFYIDWSFVAADEERTFVISYLVHNAVLVHEDVAELYYQFVGDGWEKGVHEVVITLHLPQGAAAQDIRAWGHGPVNGTVEIADGQTVRWTVQGLKAKTMVEGRVVFPPHLITSGGRRTGQIALPEILAEEERGAAETNRQRLKARVDLAASLVVGAVTLLGTILLWRRYGKAHRPDFTGEYFRELPGDYTPAELGVLWNWESVGSREFSATLLDLARRGVIRITEEALDRRGILRSKGETSYRFSLAQGKASLKPHEQAVLDLLFVYIWQGVKDGGETPAVTLADVEEYAKKNKRAFREFWLGWQELVKLAAAEHNFFETAPGEVRSTLFLGGVGALLVGIASFIFNWWFSGAALMGAALILPILGFALRRRTVRGHNDYVRWQAFRRFLLHFSELPRREVPALVIWEHYLVYAVALGVARQVIKQLEIVFPNLEEGEYRFGWGWYYYHLGTSRGPMGLTDLTSSVESTFARSIQLATGQSASGSGLGGGFSGGGGGGFGGGGGGAR